jgi:DNA-binding response OmpR family regulator
MTERRLLVVDDEPAIGAIVRRVGEGLGYKVEVIQQSSEFKRVYRNFAPDVIVLDIVMPETDGIEVIQWLAGESCTARIIVISGFNAAYTEMATKLGVGQGLLSISAMTKPLSIADLRAALE